MSPTFVTIFTIMLIIFAVYGFFSFLIAINRKLKKSVNKPIKRKEENRNENTEN